MEEQILQMVHRSVLGGDSIAVSERVLLCVSGDDNLCNTPHLSPCSPPKLGRKENGPPRSHTRKGCRLIFDDELAVKASAPKEQDRVPQHQILSSAQRGQESETNPEQKCPPEKESTCMRLFKQEGESLCGNLAIMNYAGGSE